MELSQYFKSIIDTERASVVICNLTHEIIYMNSAAVKNYEKYGGDRLLGKSLLDCHNDKSVDMIKKVVCWFSESADNNMIHTFYNERQNKDVYMVALRNDDKTLIGYYEKHEYRNKETAPLYDFENSII